LPCCGGKPAVFIAKEKMSDVMLLSFAVVCVKGKHAGA